MIDRGSTWRERAERVVRRVSNVFPAPEFENWGLCEELILDATAAYECISKFKLETKSASWLLNATGGYLYEKSNYSEDEPLYQRSLAIREKAFGKGHPEVASNLNNLASLHHLQGQCNKAEPLYQRSLAIQEKALEAVWKFHFSDLG